MALLSTPTLSLPLSPPLLPQTFRSKDGRGDRKLSINNHITWKCHFKESNISNLITWKCRLRECTLKESHTKKITSSSENGERYLTRVGARNCTVARNVRWCMQHQVVHARPCGLWNYLSHPLSPAQSYAARCWRDGQSHCDTIARDSSIWPKRVTCVDMSKFVRCLSQAALAYWAYPLNHELWAGN